MNAGNKPLEKGKPAVDLQPFFTQKGYRITNEYAIFCYFGQSYEEMNAQTYPKDKFGILAKNLDGEKEYQRSVVFGSIFPGSLLGFILFFLIYLLIIPMHFLLVLPFVLLSYFLCVRIGKKNNPKTYPDVFVGVVVVDEKTDSCQLKINGKKNLPLAKEWAKGIKEKFSLDVSVKLRSRWTKYHECIADSNTPYG